MSAYDSALLEIIPPDFEQRCFTVYARLESGEAMTLQYLADELGLPFELFASALACYAVATHGCIVMVDTSPVPAVN